MAAVATLACAAALVGCAQLGGGTGSNGGDAATWIVMDPAAVSEDTTELDIGVTRLGCASGVTGEVLEPVVAYEPDQIVITVDVARFTAGAADCQGNDVVVVTVQLDEPIGQRPLVDGACLEGEAADTSFCVSDTRWQA
jgi:hypothetical protein